MKKVKVTALCRQFGVSTSGFYAWKKRQICITKQYDDLKAVYWQHHARLCVMLDLFSRRIVGWQTSTRIDRQLVCDALNYDLHVNAIQRMSWFTHLRSSASQDRNIVVVILGHY